MKSSKLIFILTLMLMIISVGGVSAVDSVDITVSDAVSFDDGLDIQTVAVSDQSLGDNLITSGEGNATPKTWEVDDNNYDTYFDLNDDYYPGIIRADAPIKSGDTLKLGNLTSKILYIDRTLTITSMSEDSVMTNCMLQLVAGSDNSVVSGLHIYIDYAQIPDISTQLFCLAITDVDNITVKNNLFENGGKKTSGKGGSYAMAIANVTNSLFTKNTIYSFIVLDNGTKQGSDTAIQLTHSSNNIISYNDIEANGANCIYFIQNSISGIWTKPTDVSLVSVNNIIEYNTLNANAATNNAMAWVCQHYGGADNNTYRFNIICNGSMGITSSGGVGEICYNNTIYNVGTGIAAVNNFTVYNNIINATATGITAGGSAQIYNNIINVNAATGMGISVSGAMDGCLIKDNQIFVTANKSATGIKVTKQSVNGVISGNTIEVYDEANASVGINIGTTVDTAAGTMPNVVVSNNKITAQKMGIVLNKTVNCTVDGNIINLLNDDEAYGIYVACSKTNTTVAPNSTNNVISNNKINAKTGIKVGDDTSKKSIIGLEISNNEINAVDVGIDISKVESTVNDMITGIDVTISANDINVESSENAYGIYSKFGQVNVLIYENNIAVKGPFAYGVALSSANANIAKNMIKVSGNTSVGIYTNTKTNIVDNNIVANGVELNCELGLPATTIVGILASSDANVVVYGNDITTNGNYTIDLTDSSSDIFASKNMIYANKLVANKLIGDDSVTFAEGCEVNNIILDNTPIIVVITASDVVKTYKDSTKLTIILKNNHGKVIAGKSVSITIGKSSYTVTTDKNGKATLALNQAVGSYSATIKVSGADYITASKKVSIKVNKAATTVTAKKVTYKKGAKKYFSITIKDKLTGKAVSGLTIKIKVYTGKKYKTYTVKTNSKGVAKLSTKALAKGTHKVVISSGNKNYSVSKSGNLIVIK